MGWIVDSDEFMCHPPERRGPVLICKHLEGRIQILLRLFVELDIKSIDHHAGLALHLPQSECEGSWTSANF